MGVVADMVALDDWNFDDGVVRNMLEKMVEQNNGKALDVALRTCTSVDVVFTAAASVRLHQIDLLAAIINRFPGDWWREVVRNIGVRLFMDIRVAELDFLTTQSFIETLDGPGNNKFPLDTDVMSIVASYRGL